jgi:hypothetical protein
VIFTIPHKGLACKNPKGIVPWAGIQQDTSSFIKSEYLPENFAFREPSKLTKQQAITLLDYWRGRFETEDPVGVFSFHAYMDGEGIRHERPRDNRLEHGFRGPSKRPDKGKGKETGPALPRRRGYKCPETHSGTDSDSDTEPPSNNGLKRGSGDPSKQLGKGKGKEITPAPARKRGHRRPQLHSRNDSDAKPSSKSPSETSSESDSSSSDEGPIETTAKLARTQAKMTQKRGDTRGRETVKKVGVSTLMSSGNC